MTKLLLSGLACSVLLSADFNAASWRYRRELTLSAATEVSEFTVDGDTYRSSAASLDDLRITRDEVETPYSILTLTGSRRTIEARAIVVNKAWSPGNGVQAVLDLRRHAEHNRLRISTPLHNFKETVQVETSDDAHTWAVVQAAGLIFDVLRDDHSFSENTVTYPTSTRRFVRLTIPGWTDAANLTAVWLSEFKETGATRDEVAALLPAVSEDAKAQTTELILDLGFAGRPIDRVNLTVEPGLFSRTVEVSSSDDRQHWLSAAGGEIWRTAEGEQLSLDTPERMDRYLKITVFNADSEPLHFGKVTLKSIRREVRFSSAQPGKYFAYLGNANARAPSYDFERVIPSNVRPAPAALGKVEANPLFRLPERPWTDRNPWLLNGALVAAVIAMGVVTLRMLKKVS